jgi:hypothetical protein
MLLVLSYLPRRAALIERNRHLNQGPTHPDGYRSRVHLRRLRPFELPMASRW